MSGIDQKAGAAPLPNEGEGEPIAIVGMAVDLPGAPDLAQFWENLRDGVCSIERLDEAALTAAGESARRLQHPDYVPAAARLAGFDQFDPEFFGFSAKEATILDPQHRKFLEVSWHALENAGHPPERFDGPIGVYAGCGMGSYFYFNLCSNPDLVDDVGMFLLRHTGNDKDFLATRVSHVLDLKGPSVNIQTACSTSLVAVHYACDALRQGSCDMALAGGVTIELPHGRGYLFKENEILSPDGACHAFDHRAQGTVFGSGAGCVALRRLSDAQADGDHVWAVIRGSAINNDGADKASYLAPSVDGQAQAVARTLQSAGVTADSVDYVECHGTGTYLGDPIEVTALTEAFRRTTDQAGFCRIGSVKTNIGHLDTAAGVASLTKAALGLHHRQMPPSLNFDAPNPAIDFAASPFRVNDSLSRWDGRGTPRRAGVNSLGVGGTNAHALLEEAPARPNSDESDWPFQVLCLSARSKAALDANAQALAAHLRAHPDLPLADLAWTLKEGRRAFDKRRVLVAESTVDAATLLEQGDSRRVFTHDSLGASPETIFMFPGGGAQYTHMARDLYETEPVFAEWMDRGLDHLQAQLDYDIRALWLPEADAAASAEGALKKPSVQLPLIMIVEYALAQLWISWGVRPAALVGHSMGENTAACLAGVMRFEDCIDLVLLRGQLFDTVPKGGMLSVALPVDRLEALIGDDLDIASDNGPELCAVSGPDAALEALSRRLDREGVEHQRIGIDIAAHSRMLDPILGRFRSFLQGLELHAPAIPVMSNLSGEFLTDAQATDPEYWVSQLRRRVAFGACMTRLAEGAPRVFLEVGPGKALSSLAQMCPGVAPGQVLSSLRHPEQDMPDDAYFLGVIGRLWACGVAADWAQIWGEARRHRLPLPGYAFQRKRYFIEPGKPAPAESAPEALMRTDDLAQWGYRPVWQPRYARSSFAADQDLSRVPPLTWAFFMDEAGLAEAIARRLEGAGHRVIRVVPGDVTAKRAEDRYTLVAEVGREAYEALFALLAEADASPDRIGHFWLVTQDESCRPGSSFAARNTEQGFMSLMHIAQARGIAGGDAPLHMTVLTNGAEQLRDEPLPHPEKALIAGPAGVIPRELPGITVATLDIELATQAPRKGLFRHGAAPDMDRLCLHVLEDLLAAPESTRALLRGARRYERDYEALPLTAEAAPVFRSGGTYLITGGFGGIGQAVARDLLERLGANVVLLARGPLGARRQRDLSALGALGGAVMLATGDVCNPQDMSRVRDEIAARFGPVTGVIHAAGTIDDAPLLAKDSTAVDAVFAPKISGLRVLDALYPDGTLEVMVLFSSTSTVTRPAGQIDYVAANEYLNAFARSRRSGKTRVVALDWGVWAETGMAADAMAARTGAAAPDWEERPGPLLDAATEDGRGHRAMLGTDSWLIDGHRTATGDALLPGTGIIEMLAESAGGALPLEISDLHFLRPVDVPEGRHREITLHLSDAGAIELRSDATLQGRRGTVLNAQARVAPHAPQSRIIDVAAIAKRCGTVETAPDGSRIKAPQEAHLTFGPRWHVLRETRRGAGEGIARLALPETCRADAAAGYVLHPGLMDVATGWAMGLVPGYTGAQLWVPLSCASIVVLRPLPADIVSWVRLAEARDGQAGFDITLADPQGRVCAEITDFRMMALTQGTTFGKPAPVAAADIRLDAAGSAPLSPEEERLRHNIAQGIRPDEGPEALRRAVATGLPEVIVSSLDLAGLRAQADTAPAPADGSALTFERPELDDAYRAPSSETEKALAAHWEKLLGVSPVGVADSFFDLGGHSLIAVRLFALIKREFDIDFPISVLFEAPTISGLAALIEARTGRAGTAAETSGTPAEAAPRPQGFTHLVALNRSSAQRAPLFIVAGMFGNVLNLRHLAQRMGPDRAVYGLQARGLMGDDAPHATIGEAARDYLAEIRRIQPEGPYLLGGFSGGGITAYEMAHQIDAAGDSVAMLALLDTPLPVRPALSRRDKALIKLAELRRKGPRYLRDWALDRLRWELSKRAVQADTGTGFNNHKIEMAFRGAVEGYDLRPWDGHALLYRPPLDRHWPVSRGNWVSAQREYVFEDNQWRAWVPNLQVIEVTGDHDSMVLDPNVAGLARHLQEEIDRLERAGAAPRTGMSVAE